MKKALIFIGAATVLTLTAIGYCTIRASLKNLDFCFISDEEDW